jgi:hypothetical protein
MTAPALDRLLLARAVAWALLLAGWVGLGSVATVLAPGLFGAFAVVALWLLLLGVAASAASHDGLSSRLRGAALCVCAVLTAATVAGSTRGGGLTALLLALVAWAALTALASGVVRRLRRSLAARPAPPIAAAALGASCAALVLADLGDLQALTLRLGALVLAAAVALLALQPGDDPRSAKQPCRAGLFDCSLPAWPAGAWHDARQWPTLLAGLAMLPMMAALPLMAAWCRAQALPPQTMVALHFAAMFVPALLLRRSVAHWPLRRLSALCATCLGAGAVAVLWAPAPWNWLGLAIAHGAAWGLAWAGQLWAPERRARQGSSPLRSAIGYALLTLAFGVVVERFGAGGITAAHALLGLAAVLAWIFGAAAGSADDRAASAVPAAVPPVAADRRPRVG